MLTEKNVLFLLKNNLKKVNILCKERKKIVKKKIKKEIEKIKLLMKNLYYYYFILSYDHLTSLSSMTREHF